MTIIDHTIVIQKFHDFFCPIFSFFLTASQLQNRRFVNDTKNTQNRTLAVIGAQKKTQTPRYGAKKSSSITHILAGSGFREPKDLRLYGKKKEVYSIL